MSDWVHDYILFNFVGFLNAAKTLQDVDDKAAYLKFVNVYGTHFLVKTHMGARYAKETELTKISKEHLEQQNISINVAAEYSALFKLGIKIDTEIKKDMVEKFVANTIPKNVL